ncbi:MAG: NAD(+)/NADH kinase [Mariprofundaceae bacterium]|nr:NAD(+)/NADH kinase [Mariprofundaceae bacterium]
MSAKAMRSIGISSKPNDSRASEIAGELAAWLLKRGCEVLCDVNQSASFGESVSISELAKRAELLIVLGGDGTLLGAGRHLVGSDVPILGINLGRLGFLTETPVGSMFDVVAEVLSGHYKTKHHFTLQAESWRDGALLKRGVAMNDVVLQRQAHPRPIEFELYFRDQLMFRTRADGLVVATPAGSTAYALSAGGPIVHPQVEAMSVVPLCPHTLSNRPVVVPADGILKLTLLDSPQPSSLSLDGQEHMNLLQGDSVNIKKAGSICLIYLPERHYFNTLRSKLHWAGHDDG